MRGQRKPREREPDPRDVLRQLPKFPFGMVVCTPGPRRLLDQEEMLSALRRHQTGDWGDLDDEDRAVNDAAIKAGTRILSAYTNLTQTRFWVITEADRSVTTILLPEEY